MFINKAHRTRSKIKMGLQGPAGSGKTYSSLLLAKGLTSEWSRIVVIDTENGSSNLYASLGPFSVIVLNDRNPEQYINAINLAVKSEMEVIIIDSVSHCWEYLLDYHAALPGNSFTNWSKITPRHNAFVQAIIQSDAHIIVTMRTKQDYVLNQKDGKYVPEKVGLKAIQRDGLDYELTLLFELDNKHFCSASKDRTGLFMDVPEYQHFKITETTGKVIKDWINEGIDIRSHILDCDSMEKLEDLYRQYRPTAPELLKLFKMQKNILNSKMISGNGTT